MIHTPTHQLPQESMMPIASRVTFLLTALLVIIFCPKILSGEEKNKSIRQHYEVRHYKLADDRGHEKLDRYLNKALLPALKRRGIGPVGVFAPATNNEVGGNRVIVVIPYKWPAQIGRVQMALRSDTKYQAAAKDYLSSSPQDPPYQRIESELLVAMDCMPKTSVPAGLLDNHERVYELRLYESATENRGHVKVDMFNEGEVPIFLDSGIQPLFIGQAIIGPQTPSLTYLSVFPNDAARLKAWEKFRAHPDWKTLSGDPKYKATVSHIDKYILVPKPYSQM